MPFVAIADLLSRSEMQALLEHVLANQRRFRRTRVILPGASRGASTGASAFENREARVLTDLGRHARVIERRIRDVLPAALRELGLPAAQRAAIEARILALTDGDSIVTPTDAGESAAFVYCFHREPAAFEGGELILRTIGPTVDGTRRDSISGEPRANAAVIFAGGPLLEMAAVRVRTGSFSDGCFAVVGTIRP